MDQFTGKMKNGKMANGVTDPISPFHRFSVRRSRQHSAMEDRDIQESVIQVLQLLPVQEQQPEQVWQF
jgi:hypothetical protein